MSPQWMPTEDDQGNIYYYHKKSGETAWNVPVTPSSPSNEYYRNDADGAVDYANALYGYDDDVESQPKKVQIVPPSKDSVGSPYLKKKLNEENFGSPALRSPILKKAISSHAISNAKAAAAFGDGSNSINELLESDADRYRIYI
jgi:hypothetical protein